MSEPAQGDMGPLEELLGMARDEGLVALEVEVVQAPSAANEHTAVVCVSARTANFTASAVGEASPQSAPASWRPFLTTLAEIRAKARALRELTGQGFAVQEELDVPYPRGDELEERPAVREAPRPYTAPRPAPTPAPAPAPAAGSSILAAPYDPFGAPASRDEPPIDPLTFLRPASSLIPPGSAPPTPPVRRVQDDGDEPEEEEETPSPAPRMIGSAGDERSPVPTIKVAPEEEEDDDEEKEEEEDDLPDYDRIDPDMLAKLKKLAISLAQFTDKNATEDDAQRRLDAYFMKAFNHPLGKGTRNEGRLVVGTLSKQLAARNAANRE